MGMSIRRRREPKPTTLSGYGITDAASATHTHSGTYQPLDADLTAIAALAGTSGFLKKTAANTWTLDTSTYSLSSHNNSAHSEPFGIVYYGTGAPPTAVGKSDGTLYFKYTP